MKLLLQRKILLGYFVMMAIIYGMVAIVLQERNRVRKIEKESLAIYQTQRIMNTAQRYIIMLATYGESAIMWNDEDYTVYRKYRLRTDSLLLILQEQSKEFVHPAQIDTLHTLLIRKEENLLRIMSTFKEQEVTDSLLLKQLPIATAQTGRFRTVTRKKKGIAGWFGAKETVLLPSNTTKLNSLNKELISLRNKRKETLELYTDSLHIHNKELNHKLRTLITTIHDLTERVLKDKEQRIQQSYDRSMRIITGLVISAIVLLAVSYLIIYKDLREKAKTRKKMENAVELLQENIKENKRLIDGRRRIIQTITHELRTPLTAICGNAELIKDSPGQEDTARRAKVIRQSSRHMAAMLDSLLNYFRIDSGKETVCSKPFPLRNIAEMLEAEFTLQTEAKGLRLLVENHADEVVAGDKALILRIGSNLLSNAVKFTERGTVRLVTDYRNGVFTLVVEDTGCGMDKEEATRIFTPFERLSNAATKDGFGLGLSIVDTLVKMMDGDISVESGCGKGSRFTVSLSMVLAGLTETGTPDENKWHKHLSGYSVIVIEDNDVLLGTIRNIFTSNGIRCDVCRNAEELTEKIRMRSYDLVITDLKMPDMNGFDILELLRLSDIGNSRTVPVAVLTASESVSEKELLAAGFSACLFKPYSVEDLLAMSDSVIGKHLQDKTRHIKTPDFSPLLGFEDAESTLNRIISETEEDMEKLKAAANAGNVKDMSALIHKMRSSWMLIGVEGVLRTLYDRLHKDIPVKAEYAEAVERVLEQGNAIISTAKEQKGLDA